MTSYLDFNDLKTAIIGIVGGIISFFICVAIQRYWANRSIKSLKSRIEQNEAYKAQLDNYARSDRALSSETVTGKYRGSALGLFPLHHEGSFGVYHLGRALRQILWIEEDAMRP